jgi:hypothetical protein
MPEDAELVRDALRVWAPTWPRRVTRKQQTATSVDEAVDLLLAAEEDPWNQPFVSTYAFPSGHTIDGEVPVIDTLMFDFDVSGDYDGESGDVRWVRDLAALLSSVRKVARFLSDTGKADVWRASLSGGKGVHLYLDFHPLSRNAGDIGQIKRGLGTYAEALIDRLEIATGVDDLHEWVDVDSSDLSRLTRVPNTLHPGATERFGEPRYCIPVTIDELRTITPAMYIEWTKSRRPMPESVRRVRSTTATEKIQAAIAAAGPSSGSGCRSSVADAGRIDRYVEAANTDISVDDIPILFANKPCIQRWIERPDAFTHGGESHLMELFVITHFMQKRVPIDVMVEWFAQHDGFNEADTRDAIDRYVSRGYAQMSCETLAKTAGTYVCSSCNYVPVRST